MTRIWFISLLALLLIAKVCANISLVQKRDILIDRYLNKNDQPFTLEVNRRKKILETSQTIFEESPQAMKGQLLVKFEGDQATDNVDATMKEYFSLVSNDLLHPDYNLFSIKDGIPLKHHLLFGDAIITERFPYKKKKQAQFEPVIQEMQQVQFDPVMMDMDYINRLRHVGRVIGMAILNKQFMDMTFDDRLYEMIIGRPLRKFDISIKCPLEYPLSSPDEPPSRPFELDELFISDDKPEDGEPEMTDSDENGSETTECDQYGFTLTFTDEEVTKEAVLTLRELKKDNVLFSMAVLCQGIFEIIPQDAFTKLKLDKDEIKTLISGETRPLGIQEWELLMSPDRNLEQLHSAGSTQSQNQWQGTLWNGEQKDLSWFKEMSRVRYSYQFLSYITGVSRLPVGLLDGGHDQSKPYINVKWSGEVDTPPSSDPYTNTLYLSSYTSKEKMNEHFKDIFDKNMCGASTWFLSAAEFR